MRSDGRRFSPRLLLIDSGDGNLTDVVYRFCAGWNSTYPSKGFGDLVTRKKEAGDPQIAAGWRRYRAAKIGEDSTLYEIATNHYKTHAYNNLKIPRQDTGPQKAGYCNFPIDYNENYFRMLTAEEKRRDNSFHCPSGRRNEALDCRVMNLCAGDVFLDSEVLRVRAAAMTGGAKKHDLQVINHRMVLEYKVREMAPLTIDPKKKEE